MGRTEGFESVGDILNRGSPLSDQSLPRTSSRGGSASTGGGSSGQMRKETRQEEMACQTCNKPFMGEVQVYQVLGRDREFRPSECPACRQAREVEERRLAEEERRLQQVRVKLKWCRTCGIAEYLQGKTFANFDRRFQRPVFEAVKRWAERFSVEGARGYSSLMLWSEVHGSEGYGVGKTHLAVAACNHIIDSWDGDPERAWCPIRFESGPGLIRRIRATYNVPAGDEEHETEEMVYRQLRGVPLLVLDDVGKEKASPHTREVYFYVIDERLKQGLPVLITSNLPLEGISSLEDLMGPAVVSRLTGMCQGNIFELKGADFRRREKIP